MSSSVALISDVHANATALRTVLDRIREEDPRAVVCAGDIVGYGPRPAECLDLVRDVADVAVAGNHDRTVESPDRYAGHPTAGPGLRHAAETLDDVQRAWLRDLPDRDVVDGESILVAHSHPDADERGRYVYPDEFDAVARTVDANVLVLGHTHVQGAKTVDDTVVVNPGSVGQPRDGDPAAAYALVDPADRSVDLRRVPYDVDAVRKAVADAGLPERTWRRLETGT